MVTLDPAADMMLTGPLSGCCVYIAERTGFPPLFLHANANDQDGLRASKFDRFRSAASLRTRRIAQNNAYKDAEADRIARSYGYTLRRRLARGEYDIPAFVWGYRMGTTWYCFVHELDLTNQTCTNTPLSTA